MFQIYVEMRPTVMRVQAKISLVARPDTANTNTSEHCKGTSRSTWQKFAWFQNKPNVYYKQK